MRMVRHNMLQNFQNFSGDDRRQLVIDEMAKAVMIYPVALNQAIGIKGTPLAYKNLASNISASIGDPRKAKRVAQVVMMLNRNGTAYESFAGTQNTGNGGVSYRALMTKGHDFLRDNDRQVDELAQELTMALSSPEGAQDLMSTMNMYENFSARGKKRTVSKTTGKIICALVVVGVLVLAGMTITRFNNATAVSGK